ncbi:guanine deaminase [Ureibacillus chungkukjangi]|uniref:Guanine deaminase n=1 Tax=Ureibacillus chungkukjangi TaxID=1202712 RepID=A0A318TKH1_9BACL|nr:guanine deaminase [Ureibacillus chungkukjangi]MCM3389493.1 guanine deaminase [Ureibacillus chungkukjangi]PYF04320.1 guanine deaminase [Ureibacillus chungkukjangi]
MANYAQVFLGTAFTSKSFSEVTILKDFLYCISGDGIIEQLFSPLDEQYEAILKEYEGKGNFRRLSNDEYILPGFIDLHVHAPQWAQAGTALDLPLEDWLNAYTFPVEAKFSDIDFAQAVYEDLVKTLLANGTTTVLYFATVHKQASLLLAKICSLLGQRGLVGKVVMDNDDQCPDYYRDADTATALKETEEFIIEVQQLNEQTKQGVYPVVTPRFIPSCTDEALQGLGELAAKYNTHIQSHCSESDWQHGYVKDRYDKNDAFALNDFGLLQEKSVMAHCNFIADEDAKLFAETGTAAAHCPVSNVFFSNGVFPAKHIHELGVDIGLGTDVSGGFSPSLYDNIRQAVIASRMLEEGVDTTISADKRGVDSSRLTTNEAFYLATAGGGESLSLPIGKIEENYAWDVQIINTNLQNGKLPIFNDPLEDIFQKILYLARPENIREVWVQGEKVHQR